MKLKEGRFRTDIRKNFFCEGDETLEKIAQRSCGCLFPGSLKVFFFELLHVLQVDKPFGFLIFFSIFLSLKVSLINAKKCIWPDLSKGILDILLQVFT